MYLRVPKVAGKSPINGGGSLSMMDLPQRDSWTAWRVWIFTRGTWGNPTIWRKSEFLSDFMGPSKSWKQILDLRGVVGVAKMVIAMAISPTYPPKFNWTARSNPSISQSYPNYIYKVAPKWFLLVYNPNYCKFGISITKQDHVMSKSHKIHIFLGCYVVSSCRIPRTRAIFLWHFLLFSMNHIMVHFHIWWPFSPYVITLWLFNIAMV